MLRDITIGQYYPAESRVHELDPRVKIAAVFIYLISLFVFSSFIGYVVVTVFLVAAIIKSKVPFSYILKGLKPILFLLLFTAVFNIFGTKGDVLFEYKFITITWQGLRKGAFMSMRLIYLILGSSLLTYTTTPNQLTDGLETMLKPLEKIKVPVHDFAMMMSLALRFIPILLDEANRIISAQSAYDLAMAMESRCYHGGDGRTKMKPLKYKKTDKIMYGVVVGYLAVVIVVTHVIPTPF